MAPAFVCCPYDRRHRLPAECMEDHVKLCTSSGQATAYEEQQAGFFYEDCPNVVSLDSGFVSERALSKSEEYERDVAVTTSKRQGRDLHSANPIADSTVSGVLPLFCAAAAASLCNSSAYVAAHMAYHPPSDQVLLGLGAQ
eukprot:5757810-Pyramimonas_sp.AAC.1